MVPSFAAAAGPALFGITREGDTVIARPEAVHTTDMVVSATCVHVGASAAFGHPVLRTDIHRDRFSARLGLVVFFAAMLQPRARLLVVVSQDLHPASSAWPQPVLLALLVDMPAFGHHDPPSFPTRDIHRLEASMLLLWDYRCLSCYLC